MDALNGKKLVEVPDRDGDRALGQDLKWHNEDLNWA
jgi:hypothetical protein